MFTYKWMWNVLPYQCKQMSPCRDSYRHLGTRWFSLQGFSLFSQDRTVILAYVFTGHFFQSWLKTFSNLRTTFQWVSKPVWNLGPTVAHKQRGKSPKCAFWKIVDVYICQPLATRGYKLRAAHIKAWSVPSCSCRCAYLYAREDAIYVETSDLSE